MESVLKRGRILGSAVGIGLLLWLGQRPAQAIPDATTPGIVGAVVGAELGVAGPRVGSRGLPYLAYASGGLARVFSARGEILSGGGRPQMTVIGGQYALVPLPLVAVNIEPGVTSIPRASGPSLAIRATGSIPGGFHITGYARVHYIRSRATTEVGVGGDYPLVSILRVSASAIQFNGGFQPAGTLFLIGLKARVGR